MDYLTGGQESAELAWRSVWCVQGVFRGLGDTRTPFMGTLAANVLNILMDPVFIFVLGWGAPGAAFATVLSQVRTPAPREPFVLGMFRLLLPLCCPG